MAGTSSELFIRSIIEFFFCLNRSLNSGLRGMQKGIGGEMKILTVNEMVSIGDHSGKGEEPGFL